MGAASSVIGVVDYIGDPRSSAALRTNHVDMTKHG
jgi:hypothetical protein